MWIGEFAILNFYVPVESGYERPTRQLNTAELENIEKGVSKVRHKEGALKHIANLEHLTLYNKRFIQRLKMVQQTLPYSKDVAALSPVRNGSCAATTAAPTALNASSRPRTPRGMAQQCPRGGTSGDS